MDRAQADSLLQKMTQTVTGMPRVLAVLLQQQDLATSSSLRGAEPGAPAVTAYESQSGRLVEMLEGLQDKFKKELADVEQGGADEAHAFALPSSTSATPSLGSHLTKTRRRSRRASARRSRPRQSSSSRPPPRTRQRTRS